MPTDDKQWRSFLVLIAGDSEIVRRALRSVLEGCGYAVMDAATGSEVMDRVRRLGPNAVLLASRLHDSTGLDVCRRLSGDEQFDPAVPIILMAAGGTSRAERLEAYSSGAWDVCSAPLDGTALLLRLQTFLRAKQAANRARERGLVDPHTGLYNALGLAQRIRELAADAVRRRESLACIVFTSDRPEGLPDVQDEWVLTLAAQCRELARRSDAMGRLNGTEFAIVAPDTDAGGAVQLIDRLQRLLDHGPRRHGAGRVRLRAGYCATSSPANFAIDPGDMLDRAAAALRAASDSRAQADLSGTT